MDLRRYSPSRTQALAATATLNYQPFIITDDVQTGVASSWLHSDDPRDDRFWKFVFHRDRLPADIWVKAADANTRLSRRLFRKSVEQRGFGNIVELPYRDTWLPAQWYAPHKAWLCMRG